MMFPYNQRSAYSGLEWLGVQPHVISLIMMNDITHSFENAAVKVTVFITKTLKNKINK